MREEKVFIPSAGIELEGLMTIHEALPLKAGVILCHPHPLHGGNMRIPVIKTAADAALEEGISTLRFNFRGVGESGGSYGEGVGEQEDVKAAIDYLSTKLEASNPSLFVLGYSFGAWVGLPVAVREKRVKGMVAVAPPLGLYDFEYLKGCKKRKLIIVGNQDLYCPTNRLEEWYQVLEEPKSLAIIEGADHFFFHQHRSLTQPLREFFRKKSSEDFVRSS